MAAAKPGSKQEKLNKAMPAMSKAKMGDVIAELIVEVNSLKAKHNALAAKLDADAGVTDTSYVSLTGVSATAIKDLESR